ncbi:MAG: hypothetical protein D6767_04540, partial [Candidatus Hydrogenedentota bacterium]
EKKLAWYSFPWKFTLALSGIQSRDIAGRDLSGGKLDAFAQRMFGAWYAGISLAIAGTNFMENKSETDGKIYTVEVGEFFVGAFGGYQWNFASRFAWINEFGLGLGSASVIQKMEQQTIQETQHRFTWLRVRTGLEWMAFKHVSFGAHLGSFIQMDRSNTLLMFGVGGLYATYFF